MMKSIFYVNVACPLPKAGCWGRVDVDAFFRRMTCIQIPLMPGSRKKFVISYGME